MKCALLCIGTEINLGIITNTNAAFIAEKLSERGFECNLVITVKDNKKEIKDSLLYLLSESDAVVISGGLGPTDDDLTREAVAESIGTDLVKLNILDNNSLRFVRKDISNEFKERLLKQSYIPKGAFPIVPRIGSASGFVVKICEGKKLICSIPGVPKEAKDMFSNDILKALTDFQDTSKNYSLKILKKIILTTGLFESEVEDKINDLYDPAKKIGVDIGITASPGLIRLMLVSKSSDSELNKENIEKIQEALKQRIGRNIYGYGEDKMGDSLKKAVKSSGKKIKLCAAESVTGGLISDIITDTEGSSEYFRGSAVVYSIYAKEKIIRVDPHVIKKYGMVSREVCIEMARQAKELFNCDYAVSTTGYAGPSSNDAGNETGHVFMGLIDADGKVVVFERIFHGNRTEIKFRVSHFIINELRLKILEDFESGK